jgi:hypothetical protein
MSTVAVGYCNESREMTPTLSTLSALPPQLALTAMPFGKHIHVLFNARYVIGMRLLTIKTNVHCGTIEIQDNVYVKSRIPMT